MVEVHPLGFVPRVVLICFFELNQRDDSLCLKAKNLLKQVRGSLAITEVYVGVFEVIQRTMNLEECRAGCLLEKYGLTYYNQVRIRYGLRCTAPMTG